MVHAYLHLDLPRSLRDIEDIFHPDDEVHVEQIFPNSFLLYSAFISPSQLRRDAEIGLAGSRYAIMQLKGTRGSAFTFYPGRAGS